MPSRRPPRPASAWRRRAPTRGPRAAAVGVRRSIWGSVRPPSTASGAVGRDKKVCGEASGTGSAGGPWRAPRGVNPRATGSEAPSPRPRTRRAGRFSFHVSAGGGWDDSRGQYAVNAGPAGRQVPTRVDKRDPSPRGEAFPPAHIEVGTLEDGGRSSTVRAPDCESGGGFDSRRAPQRMRHVLMMPVVQSGRTQSKRPRHHLARPARAEG